MLTELSYSRRGPFYKIILTVQWKPTVRRFSKNRPDSDFNLLGHNNWSQFRGKHIGFRRKYYIGFVRSIHTYVRIFPWTFYIVDVPVIRKSEKEFTVVSKFNGRGISISSYITHIRHHQHIIDARPRNGTWPWQWPSAQQRECTAAAECANKYVVLCRARCSCRQYVYII